ncbi:hypothetical protein L7F22_044000 [Adiantum nelumboides]|nr:hypothetical protein [Adiantum nelumboides]
MSGSGEQERDNNKQENIQPSLKNAFTEEGRLKEGYQESATKHFHFPFPLAYEIQLELAFGVYMAIQDEKVAVFESPTGTGKTFSLISGAGTWLLHQMQDNRNEKKRAREDSKEDQIKADESIKSTESNDDKKEWKRKHWSESKESHSNEDQVKADESTESNDDEPEWKRCHWSRDESGIFMPLRESVAQENTFDKPKYKIIYVSRTYSQLDQINKEYKKTDFGKLSSNTRLPLRTIPLSSRKQTCINEKVREVQRIKGVETMNEYCLELRRNQIKKNKQKNKEWDEAETCCSMPHTGKSEGKEDQHLRKFINEAHQEPRDIEELVELGKSKGICPYYGAREAAKEAQFITMTYDLLFNASARKRVGVSLENSIVIIDEAHNIVEKILQINSPVLTATQVKSVLSRIDLMPKGVRDNRQRSFLSELAAVLRSIDLHCSSLKSKFCKTPANFIIEAGIKIDRSIVLQLEDWLERSEELDEKSKEKPLIQIEIEGEDDKERRKEEQAERYTRSIRPIIRSIQAFLLLLTDEEQEGRVHFPNPQDKGNKDKWTLKYQLLDPSKIFEDIINQSRSVILAGGTMEPLSDFTDQLFPQLSKDRFMHYSFPHIVPKENLFSAITCNSISGTNLNYTFEKRSKPETLNELTEMLIEFSKVIPDGIVVFVPSYAYFNDIQNYWNRSTDQYKRLKEQKSIFFEPKDSTEVEEVLKDYSDAINQPNQSNNQRKGALLLAVMNAKLSEGINFKDNMGRAVIVVSLPYAFKNDPELVQKQAFVRRRLELKLRSQENYERSFRDAGNELYTNCCMKTVSQAIGRVLRHQNDYAAIILLDSRYEKKEHKKRLPSWIQESTKVYEDFNQVINNLQAFFESKASMSPA